MTKMFGNVDETWNAWSGCEHDCTYCWARDLAENKLSHVERYQSGFMPRLNELEFRKSFKAGIMVFVCDMGDLFGEWVPAEAIQRVIDHISKFWDTTFLFMTKNPARYHEFEFPRNCILGATIETDREELTSKVSSAPTPEERFVAMRDLKHPRKAISVEPIMRFTHPKLGQWIKEIGPEFVYVGYDNYENKLVEPSENETMWFIFFLERFTKVIKKTIREARA